MRAAVYVVHGHGHPDILAVEVDAAGMPCEGLRDVLFFHERAGFCVHFENPCARRALVRAGDVEKIAGENNALHVVGIEAEFGPHAHEGQRLRIGDVSGQGEDCFFVIVSIGAARTCKHQNERDNV